MSQDEVCHCGALMQDHSLTGSCTSPRAMTDPGPTEPVAFYEDDLGLYFAAVMCPRCAAGVGDRCLTVSGNRLEYYPINCHAGRYKNAPKEMQDAYTIEQRKRDKLPPVLARPQRTFDRKAPARTPEDRVKVMLWALARCEDDFPGARDALERAIQVRTLMTTMGPAHEGRATEDRR